MDAATHKPTQTARNTLQTLSWTYRAAQTSSMRLTRGTFTDGTPFATFDNWRNHETAHLDMLDHWIGTTTFFNYDCANLDDHIHRLCALHDSDVNMPQIKRVTFDEASNTHYDIIGYSEVYHVNPHTILSTAAGWKTNPGRADFFTGKSSTVTKARRKQIRASMKPQAARKARLEILAAYQELQAALGTHQSPPPGPTPHGAIV